MSRWHPHCTALRVEAGYGARVDLSALDRGEPLTIHIDGVPVFLRSRDDLKAFDVGELSWCGYVDLDVSWTDEEPAPEWRCPSCGSTQFEGIEQVAS